MEMTIHTKVRLDAANVTPFNEEMNKALSDGVTELTVDMNETNYICSAGLRVFLSVHKKLRASGGNMLITNVKPQIMEIFEVTGFSGVLNFE